MVWSERLLIRPVIAASTSNDQPAYILYRQGCSKQVRVEICPAQIETALQIIAPHALSLNAASAFWRDFSPLRDAKLVAFRASASAALAVSGSRSLALPDPADRSLPSQEKLTE